MPATNTRLIVHLSDLHFGREDRRVVHGLYDAVWALTPDVVVVSGDLTQRARRRQFVHARTFLDGLPRPQLTVPGNHDVPLFNIVARLLHPLNGYVTNITRDLQPTLIEGCVWITGINTTRPRTWKSGGVDPATIDRLRGVIAAAPRGSIRILVAHHPFDAPDGNPAATDALSVLTAAGIDVFLTGHLHASYTGHTAHRYNVGGRTAVVVEAGTATSTRLRGENNAFNVLRVSRDAIEVELRTWDGRAFVAGSTQRFSRTADGWTAAGGDLFAS
jgi:3',5'-cyclic AMP phosphodiesterase CpdA